MNSADLFSCFGDVIELNFPKWNIDRLSPLLKEHHGWKPYNPRRPNNRFGLSATSIDGQYSGVPDLDSLHEYNLLNNTNLGEKDFKIRTDIVNQVPELQNLLDTLEHR